MFCRLNQGSLAEVANDHGSEEVISFEDISQGSLRPKVIPKIGRSLDSDTLIQFPHLFCPKLCESDANSMFLSFGVNRNRSPS
jgi:hypothetical protein